MRTSRVPSCCDKSHRSFTHPSPLFSGRSVSKLGTALAGRPGAVCAPVWHRNFLRKGSGHRPPRSEELSAAIRTGIATSNPRAAAGGRRFVATSLDGASQESGQHVTPLTGADVGLRGLRCRASYLVALSAATGAALGAGDGAAPRDVWRDRDVDGSGDDADAEGGSMWQADDAGECASEQDADQGRLCLLGMIAATAREQDDQFEEVASRGLSAVAAATAAKGQQAALVPRAIHSLHAARASGGGTMRRVQRPLSPPDATSLRASLVAARTAHADVSSKDEATAAAASVAPLSSKDQATPAAEPLDSPVAQVGPQPRFPAAL